MNLKWINGADAKGLPELVEPSRRGLVDGGAAGEVADGEWIAIPLSARMELALIVGPEVVRRQRTAQRAALRLLASFAAAFAESERRLCADSMDRNGS